LALAHLSPIWYWLPRGASRKPETAAEEVEWGEMISRGSEWHRWEPHIHAPGTIFNNQFGGSNPWDAYLRTLEGVTPEIEPPRLYMYQRQME
jgi:hypothetical protein